jgi:AcrR family transcriptional regulator
VQLVVREAGVSARTFYRHFADKDELLLALLRDEMARAAAHLRAAVGRVDEPAGQVEAWIGAVIGAAADPRRIARARLFSEQQAVMRRFPGEVDDGVESLVAPLRESIERGFASGAFPWADPARDAVLVYRLTGGSLTAALARGAHAARDLATVVDATTAFALRALGVAPRSAS